MSLIEAIDICFENYCDELSLRDISFEIEEKGVYGFLGKSKSGKTALATLLAGVERYDDGFLLYKDTEMYSNKKSELQIKKKIGYVPEKCFFDEDMTVFEVLDFTGMAKHISPDKRYRQIKEAMELMGLTELCDMTVETIGATEKKRLGIASAILGNPDVIIFDEPMKNLEKRWQDELKGLISMLSSKKVILIFTSSPTDIEEMCRGVAIMSHGKIVLSDKVENIKSKLEAHGLSGLSLALEAFDAEGK